MYVHTHARTLRIRARELRERHRVYRVCVCVRTYVHVRLNACRGALVYEECVCLALSVRCLVASGYDVL